MLKAAVALVTGGTGYLGYGVVHRFARKGAHVVLSDLPSSNGDKIAKELGDNVTFIPADVRSEKDVQQLVDEIKNKHNSLNIIANCAGTSCIKPFYNFTESRPIRLEDFHDVIQTNVIGTYNVCRLAAGLMVGQFESSNSDANSTNVIVNTAGVEGIGDQKLGRVINAVTTNAIVGMTKHLSKDFSPYGIRVVSVLASGFKSTEKNQSSDGYHFGSPDEFGFIVQSLALNGYINSEAIEVDGGQRLRKI